MPRPSFRATALVFLLLGLAGCFPRGTEVVRPPVSESKSTTVVVAHWIDDGRFGASLARAASGQGIDITGLYFPRERYLAEVTSLMLVRKGPDVFALPEDEIPSYLNENWLSPLGVATAESRFDLATLAVEPDARPLAAVAPYYVPFTIQTCRLLYNRGIFRRSGLDPQRAPRTIGELYAFARRIGSSPAPVARAFVLPMGEGIQAFREVFESSAFRSGLAHYQPDRQMDNLTIYEPWLRLLARMDRESLLLPGWKTLTKQAALENFLRGNVAMLVANSDDFAYIETRRPKTLDIGVGLVPALGPDVQEGDARAGYGFVVNAQARSLPDSLAVVRLLYSRQLQDALLRDGIANPATSKSWRPAGDRAFQGFSFVEFLPLAGERLRFSPQDIYDSAILFEAYRTALQEPDRMPDVLHAAEAVVSGRFQPMRIAARQ